MMPNHQTNGPATPDRFPPDCEASMLNMHVANSGTGLGTRPTLLDEAIRYHVLGWSIIPLERGTKRSPTRHRWKRWTRDRPRRRQLERWFGSKPRNLAVVLGPVSGGLACRDFDDEDAYLRWRDQNPQLAELLPTSRTRRGYHVFFIADHGDTGLPTAGVLKLPDGELRVRGCHVTLPPSQHPDGGRYEWLQEPFHVTIPRIYSVTAAGLVTTAPQSVICGAGTPSPDTYQHKPTQDQKSDGSEVLYGADGNLLTHSCDAVLGWTVPIQPGTREHCLWQLARQLKSLEQTRWMRVDQLEPILRYWWRLALPHIATKEWALTWGAFARAWARAFPVL